MLYRSITFKLIVYIIALLITILGIVLYLNVEDQKKQLLNEVIRGATQFSDTVIRSTQYDMLRNQRSNVYRIINYIGMQQGISRVRIFNKEGYIMVSTDPSEIGRFVNKSEEQCYACHAVGKPLEKLSTPKRTRIFKLANGNKVLGMITPIYNEPECSSASCHAHPASQKVLGVLDISMSLNTIEHEIKGMEIRSIIIGIVTMFFLSILMIIVIKNIIGKPIKKLTAGTNRIAGGNLEERIVVNTHDEMGELANAFNDMMNKLNEAKNELLNLVETLENKVEERTHALKAAQDNLIRSEKLASIGKLSATVAHEINNPITGVLTYIKLMLKKLKRNDTSEEDIKKYIEYLSIMERETERTSGIVKNLLDFSRQREPHYKLVDINTIIEETLMLVRNQINLQGINVIKSFSEIPQTMADADQLKQAFMNIIINACEAMKEGEKKLTIETGFDNSKKDIKISIKDTGTGIPEEDINKVFEPFYTTKEKGTGLGLAVVYGIITKHQGRIDIASKKGEGTTVKLMIPLNENKSTAT
jgi:two-component system NtrC family sensor kinase